ncbi:MAG: hypothetical protein V3S03_08360 [Vicinamibacteria bacterium]
MHPERAIDRVHLLEDFGVDVKVEPAAGGRAFEVLAQFQRGPRAVDLDLGGGLTTVEITGSDPWLFMRSEDARRIRELDVLTVPGEAFRFRVHQDKGPDEDDGDFRLVHLLEATAA